MKKYIRLQYEITVTMLVLTIVALIREKYTFSYIAVLEIGTTTFLIELLFLTEQRFPNKENPILKNAFLAALGLFLIDLSFKCYYFLPNLMGELLFGQEVVGKDLIDILNNALLPFRYLICIYLLHFLLIFVFYKPFNCLQTYFNEDKE